jgi:outer membrane protein OmpA-like peptidoglycan-associated protein
MVLSRSRLSIVGIAALAGMMTLSGCLATRKFTREEVAKVQPQIQEVSNANKENAERIDAVDRRATAGITAAQTSADKANTAAATAQTAAQAADRKADTANQGVQQANNRINTVETRLNSLNDNYTAGQTQSITFANDSATLSDEAKATLDQIASSVSGMRTGYLVELQGFTDDRGGENYNANLSQRRAEAALRYLVSKSVPLFRISIVGLGEANPVAPNNTREGRGQNRRVEVRVLRSASGQTSTN